MLNLKARAQIAKKMREAAIPPTTIIRVIAFAIEQLAAVDVNEIVMPWVVGLRYFLTQRFESFALPGFSCHVISTLHQAV